MLDSIVDFASIKKGGALEMMKFAARYVSTALFNCAKLFTMILKWALHSPEIPKELQ